jgi:hypothetical protein
MARHLAITIDRHHRGRRLDADVGGPPFVACVRRDLEGLAFPDEVTPQTLTVPIALDVRPLR